MATDLGHHVVATESRPVRTATAGQPWVYPDSDRPPARFCLLLKSLRTMRCPAPQFAGRKPRNGHAPQPVDDPMHPMAEAIPRSPSGISMRAHRPADAGSDARVEPLPASRYAGQRFTRCGERTRRPTGDNSLAADPAFLELLGKLVIPRRAVAVTAELAPPAPGHFSWNNDQAALGIAQMRYGTATHHAHLADPGVQAEAPPSRARRTLCSSRAVMAGVD